MFNNLPRDIILSISMNLTFIDICKLKQTCKRFHQMSNFNLVYHHILKRDYDHDLTDINLAEKLLIFALYRNKNIDIIKYLIKLGQSTYDLTRHFPEISFPMDPCSSQLQHIYELAFNNYKT